MTDYTAEDGLNILTYLRLTNLTDGERQVFKEKWDAVYREHKDVIGTVWTLYSKVLPFVCGDGDKGSFLVAQVRDREFYERLDESELDKKLEEGIPLKEIFA